MDKILIVDGSNLLFQMFFGMPARITGRDGRAVQGTLGFVGALIKMIKKVRPTHVAVLFDSERGSARSELDPDYKANRPDYSEVDEDENPFTQLPDIYAALDHLGIRHTESVGCEVDDIIAEYAKEYGASCDMVISSFDSDFFQLITDRVSVLRYRGDSSVICTPEYVRGRLGVTPEQYADFKSLVGDTADNIRGVDRIGPKTAAALLSEFGTLEGIIAGVDYIKKPAVRESVRSSSERMRTNYKLIRLVGCGGLPFLIDDMRWSYGEQTTSEVLRAVGIF